MVNLVVLEVLTFRGDSRDSRASSAVFGFSERHTRYFSPVPLPSLPVPLRRFFHSAGLAGGGPLLRDIFGSSAKSVFMKTPEGTNNGHAPAAGLESDSLDHS